MLLNLDLFRPQPEQGDPGETAANSNDSMLEQILTLNALGYLGNNGVKYGGAGAGGSLGPSIQPPSQEYPE
jgi:hypothetical protein